MQHVPRRTSCLCRSGLLFLVAQDLLVGGHALNERQTHDTEALKLVTSHLAENVKSISFLLQSTAPEWRNVRSFALRGDPGQSQPMFLSAASVTRREFVGDRQEPDGIVGLDSVQPADVSSAILLQTSTSGPEVKYPNEAEPVAASEARTFGDFATDLLNFNGRLSIVYSILVWTVLCLAFFSCCILLTCWCVIDLHKPKKDAIVDRTRDELHEVWVLT